MRTTARLCLRRLAKSLWIRPASPSERRTRRSEPLAAPGWTAIPALVPAGPRRRPEAGPARSWAGRPLPAAHRPL
jgi:hypothetical protein